MKRFYSCLYALALCQAVVSAPSQKAAAPGLFITQASDQDQYKEKYTHLQQNFNDVVKAKDVTDYQLSCQNQKLAHILAFSDLQKKSLESRNAELIHKNYAQDKELAEKNKHVARLFEEINAIRTMLRNSLNTRNNLERAYLNLDQKLQVTQQNFAAQTKHLNHKLIDLTAAKTTSLMSESKALQQVAHLEQALRDNEQFYTKDMYKTFDSLAQELEETRKQLNIATDACFETEQELSQVKKQLEATQSLLTNGGVSAKSERELKAIQTTLAKLGKDALESKGSYHQQLTQALEHIKLLDQKLNKAQQEAERNHKDIQQRAAREAKHSQDFKIISSDLAKLKREYQSNIAQNTFQLTRTIKGLETELQSTKAQALRTFKSIQAKDMAFGALERHSKGLQALVAQEEATQKTLVKDLHSKEVELRNVHAKLARLDTTEQNLRLLVSKTQQELASETQKSKSLAAKLRNVSQKLASAELERDKVSYQNTNLQKDISELSKKLMHSEGMALALTEERNNYMFERHAFARMAEKAVADRNMFAERYQTLLKTVSRARENSKLGITEAHPVGIAIL